MKKIIILLLCIVFSTQIVQASEKIPIKITPAQKISTHHDEIEVGDYIKFKVVNDVYYKGILYITKNETVIGIVSNIHENGYFFDNAEIILNPFKVKIFNNTVITIDSTLTLNRKDFVCKNFGDKIIKYFGVMFRGNEIGLQPETIEYNIFLIK